MQTPAAEPISSRHYSTYGGADRPPLVLLHGSRVTRAMWGPQVQGLADDFRLIVPDLPGHGSRAAERFTIDSAVAATAAVVDAAAGGQALVAGLSMGGYVALAFGAAHPQRAAGLVLAGCSYSFRGAMGQTLGAPYYALSRLGAGTAAPLLARLDERVFRSRYADDVAGPVIRSGFYYRAFAEIVAALRTLDPLPLLRAYPGPTLLLNGMRDPIFRRGERAYLAALRSGSLKVIPGASHLVSLDQPEAFNTALRDFARAVGYLQSP